MWSRKELKEKAKIRIHANYWRCVLAALILTVIAASGAASSGGNGASSTVDTSNLFHGAAKSEAGAAAAITGSDDIISEIESEIHPDRGTGSKLPKSGMFGLFAVVGIILFVTFLIIGIVMTLLNVLLFNPLSVGCYRFFTKNLNEDARIKEVCYAFDSNYKNIIKIMFFKDLFTFLWTLLFVIPGIVKSYEYRMIPYILSENPSMDKDAAFALSKEMMNGNKWKAFVLDLSWLGWQILNLCTLGFLGIFYLNPYIHQTDAALYEALKSQPVPENF